MKKCKLETRDSELRLKLYFPRIAVGVLHFMVSNVVEDSGHFIRWPIDCMPMNICSILH